MTSLIDRANQAILDRKNQVLQSNKYLISLIKELVEEIPRAYEDGCKNACESDEVRLARQMP